MSETPTTTTSQKSIAVHSSLCCNPPPMAICISVLSVRRSPEYSPLYRGVPPIFIVRLFGECRWLESPESSPPFVETLIAAICGCYVNDVATLSPRVADRTWHIFWKGLQDNKPECKHFCRLCNRKKNSFSSKTTRTYQERKRNPKPNFLIQIFSGGVGVFHVKGWGPE